MLPSTVVQPLTLKVTEKAPPPALRSSALVVRVPVSEPVPSLTAPPAWKAEATVGKLVLPAQLLPEPVVEVLFPAVMDAKSSDNAVAPPPPPPAVMVRVRRALPVPVALVAEMVTLEVPAAVGAPEMRPVEVLTLRPEGRPVAAKEVGVLLAAI